METLDLKDWLSLIAIIGCSLVLVVILLYVLWKVFRFFCVNGRKASWRDMSHSNILVTGSSSGIGKETAKILAGMKGNIIMGCRNPKKSDKAMKYIKKRYPDSKLSFIPLDLSKPSTITEFVKTLEEKNIKLDVCIHNAGVMNNLDRKLANSDGFEYMFSVNCLGTFFLTRLLIDSEIMKKKSRFVFVSALSHKFLRGGILKTNKFSDFFRHPVPTPNYFYMPFMSFHQYSVAKLFMIMLTYQLHRKYHEETEIDFNLLHPGVIRTNFSKGESFTFFYDKIYNVMSYLFFKTVEQGSQCSVHLAISQKLSGVSGKYFSDLRIESSSGISLSEKNQEEIWGLCDKIFRDTFE